MSLKRIADGVPKDVQHKRVKCDAIEECQKKETLSNDCNGQDPSQPVPPLLTLSDEILLYIIRFLDPRDAINLGRACVRLNCVVRDRALWTRVELRRRAMMLCQLPAFLPFLRPSTRRLLTRGPCPLPPRQRLPPAPFDQMIRRRKDLRRCTPAASLRALAATCPSLEVLYLQRHCFDGSKVSLTDFPSSLRRLNLSGCELQSVSIDRSYFRGINNHMVMLQDLVLEGCQWLSADCLMAISKCPILRRLSLRHCRNVGSCYVYISLSTRFGFKALEMLDVRGTALVDHEISCFQNLDSLAQLWLEPPPRWLPREFSYHTPDCRIQHSHKVPCPVASQGSSFAAAASSRMSAPVQYRSSAMMSVPAQYGVEEVDEGRDVRAWRGLTRCECPPRSPPPPSPPPPGHPFHPNHLPIVHINLFNPRDGTAVTHTVSAGPGDCACARPSRPPPGALPSDGGVPEDVAATLGRGDAAGGVGDRGLMALGTRVVVELDAAAEPAAQPQMLRRNPRLERLFVRNCPRVTDAALRHLALHEPLRFLDVRNTAVTLDGVEAFTVLRPDVTLFTDHPPP